MQRSKQSAIDRVWIAPAWCALFAFWFFGKELSPLWRYGPVNQQADMAMYGSVKAHWGLAP
jgi:hypothetical protein